MPEYQLLRCLIALGGDTGNTVYRHRGNPITFPELPILQHIHGDEAVTDIHLLGHTDEMSNEEMRHRLNVLYGEEIAREVYPGTRPRYPMGDPNIPPCKLKIHIPGPTLPDSPDPILRPLDQFTLPGARKAAKTKAPEPYEIEGPATPRVEDDDEGPTPDTVAAHEDEQDEFGLGDMVAAQPRNYTTRDNHARGSRRDRVGQEDHLPDVAAGGSQNRANRHLGTGT